MNQKGMTKIMILKGLLVLDGSEFHKGTTLEVDSETLAWLKGKRSPNLDFSEVKAEQKSAGKAPKSTDKGPAATGNQGSDKDPGAPDAGDTEGGDDDLDQDPDSDPANDQGAEGAGNSDQGAQGALGLKSVDAALEARLAEAGLDSLEKLREVSVGKLTTIKGVGKVRAEAIKAEVEAL